MAKPAVVTTGNLTTITRKEREKIDPNETPRERFKRVAQTRLTLALTGITNLGKIGNAQAGQYDYAPEDVARIKASLESAYTQAMGHLVERKPSRKARAAELFD